jgi:hypothetical protein
MRRNREQIARKPKRARSVGSQIDLLILSRRSGKIPKSRGLRPCPLPPPALGQPHRPNAVPRLLNDHRDRSAQPRPPQVLISPERLGSASVPTQWQRGVEPLQVTGVSCSRARGFTPTAGGNAGLSRTSTFPRRRQGGRRRALRAAGPIRRGTSRRSPTTTSSASRRDRFGPSRKSWASTRADRLIQGRAYVRPRPSLRIRKAPRRERMCVSSSMDPRHVPPRFAEDHLRQSQPNSKRPPGPLSGRL